MLRGGTRALYCIMAIKQYRYRSRLIIDRWMSEYAGCRYDMVQFSAILDWSISNSTHSKNKNKKRIGTRVKEDEEELAELRPHNLLLCSWHHTGIFLLSDFPPLPTLSYLQSFTEFALSTSGPDHSPPQYWPGTSNFQLSLLCHHSNICEIPLFPT